MSFCILNPCFNNNYRSIKPANAEKQLLKEKVVLVSVFVKKLCKIDRLAFLQANGVPA
jgi:hypothetical protein